MKPSSLLQLFPEPGERPLSGLYLAHRLHELGSRQAPFVYANFVSSLDGRIALMQSGRGRAYVPETLTTPSDWWLFQELQAQADCFVTHGGYLRALAAGELGNILQIGAGAETARLHDWRARHGLGRQPAIVIASSSLDFPVPESIGRHGQALYIATGEKADRQKVQAWQRRGYEVMFAGSGSRVEGAALVSALSERGYKSLYLQTGPLLLESMIRDFVLSRLYLTISHQLLGGTQFHTLLGGTRLQPPGRLALHTLYLEQGSEDAPGQFFACFERSAPRPRG